MPLILFVTGLVFFILKIIGVIAWSWWAVLAPWLALPALFLLLFIAMVLGVSVAAALMAGMSRKKTSLRLRW